jgi:hypothetical protein
MATGLSSPSSAKYRMSWYQGGCVPLPIAEAATLTVTVSRNTRLMIQMAA